MCMREVEGWRWRRPPSVDICCVVHWWLLDKGGINIDNCYRDNLLLGFENKTFQSGRAISTCNTVGHSPEVWRSLFRVLWVCQNLLPPLSIMNHSMFNSRSVSPPSFHSCLIVIIDLHNLEKNYLLITLSWIMSKPIYSISILFHGEGIFQNT